MQSADYIDLLEPAICYLLFFLDCCLSFFSLFLLFSLSPTFSLPLSLSPPFSHPLSLSLPLSCSHPTQSTKKDRADVLTTRSTMSWTKAKCLEQSPRSGRTNYSQERKNIGILTVRTLMATALKRSRRERGRERRGGNPLSHITAIEHTRTLMDTGMGREGRRRVCLDCR